MEKYNKYVYKIFVRNNYVEIRKPMIWKNYWVSMSVLTVLCLAQWIMRKAK